MAREGGFDGIDEENGHRGLEQYIKPGRDEGNIYNIIPGMPGTEEEGEMSAVAVIGPKLLSFLP